MSSTPIPSSTTKSFPSTLSSTSRRLAQLSPEQLDSVRSILSTSFLAADLARISLDEISALADQNKVAITVLRGVVIKHLDKNGRRFVGMSSLFSFMV